MTRRSVRRSRKDRLARRRVLLRGGPLAGATLVLVTAGTALTAGLVDLPVTSADYLQQPWPTFTLLPSPTYADATGPTTVTFSIDPAGDQARARVNDGTSPNWSDCTSGDGITWSCSVHSTTGTFEWFAVP